MITVKALKELLEKIPNDATCYAYEGEDIGLVIRKGTMRDHDRQNWFIRAKESDKEDKHIEGFQKE